MTDLDLRAITIVVDVVEIAVTTADISQDTKKRI
jgi:hypothetical protein